MEYYLYSIQMTSEAYLFDLDNCIVSYPIASIYFYNILKKTAHEPFNYALTPSEIKTFWSLGFKIDNLIKS